MIQFIIIAICFIAFFAWCCRDFNYTPAFVVKVKNHIKRVQDWKAKRKLIKRKMVRIRKAQKEVKELLSIIDSKRGSVCVK